MKDFEEIKIIKLNKNGSRDLGGKLFEMHLELSASPAPEWCRFFQDAWEETFFHTNRNVQILEGEILISCTPDELQGEHMYYLKRATSEANERYLTLLAQRKKRTEEGESLREEQQKQLDGIESQLDFG